MLTVPFCIFDKILFWGCVLHKSQDFWLCFCYIMKYHRYKTVVFEGNMLYNFDYMRFI